MARICYEATYSSPIGELRLFSDGAALTEIQFPQGKHVSAQSGRQHLDAVLEEAVRQLHAYFCEGLETFDVPLQPRGTPFQKRVWAALCDIPYGETASYADVARAIGQPTACRAVGAANGRNPIPIIVPCHRVIGANGSLVGFGGGLDIKRFLLELEQMAVCGTQKS